MATDTLIQTGISTTSNPAPLCRGKDGTLFAVYTNVGGFGTIAYSTDGGIIWNEVVSATGTVESIVAAIDSVDAVHVLMHKSIDETLHYRKFEDGAWGADETVYGTGSNNYNGNNLDIAVDSSDIPHVAFGATSAQDFLRYTNRAGGSWAVSTLLDSTSEGVFGCRIALDSNENIYIVYTLDSTPDTVKYVKYTTFWTAPVALNTLAIDVSDAVPTMVIDSSDNVWVVWQISTGKHLYYAKYTESTDTWSAEARIGTETDAIYPSLSRDSSDNLNLFYHKTTDSPTDIYYSQYTGSWSAPVKILNASAPDAFSTPQTRSHHWPIVGGENTNIPDSGYTFLYLNTITGTKTLRYYSSPAVYPTPQTKNYSRASTAALGASDTNLGTTFTGAGYGNVLTQDLVYEDQTANDEYSVTLFKNKGNAPTDVISVSWVGKAALAPSASTVYLQIYNRNSSTWETLDSNGTAGANSPFSLTGTKSTGLSNYYDGSNWVSCRIYQLAQ